MPKLAANEARTKMSNSPKTLTFDEGQIQDLFGHEAAENESKDRLRQYYFKTGIYDQVIADLPLRILVGHKGIGKSALFQIAMAEEHDAQKLTVLIKPDDVVDLGGNASDFLSGIRDWKLGIIHIVAKKILTRIASENDSAMEKLTSFGGRLIDFVSEVFQNHLNMNLAPGNKSVIESFLKHKSIYVYIDDLDRGWQGGRQDILRLSALLNAVRDISTDNPGIYFRIAMRSDVYFLVRTSDESTDKIEGSVIWHKWTNHEIFALWVKRIESFFGRAVSERDLLGMRQQKLAYYLTPLMEERFHGSGHWEKAPMYRVFMSLIRRRPRDLVKLCTLAARQARIRNSNKIATVDLKNSFEEYSQGRLQDTINEFRSELPEIDRLLMNMKPNQKERRSGQGYIYRTDQLRQKIKNIMQLGDFRFAAQRNPASPDELKSFMYKINFLTARRGASSSIVTRYFFEESRYLSGSSADFGFDWEVHPAYRWALQPDDVLSIFQRLELSSDES